MAANGVTFLEALDHWASTTPNKRLYTFFNDSCSEVVSYTYGEFSKKTATLGNALLNTFGLKPGDRVLLVYPPSLDFIVAFVACLRVGVIAVPVYPPDPNRLKKDLYMFLAIQRSSDAQVAITSSSYNLALKINRLKQFFTLENQTWPELHWYVTDEYLKSTDATMNELPLSIRPTGEFIAFLQYTSGSTSEPKGVMVTHDNLKDNLSLITHGISGDSSIVVVSWLPQYHDMGLIGSYLTPLFLGASGYYTSPITFIKNPTLWVTAISKYQGTHMQAPNFAYGLVARKFMALKSKPKLELSCARHVINAAEPIDAATIDLFYAVFEPYGLKRVVFPTYGLAEHTVYVTSNGQQRLTVNKEKLASNIVEEVDPSKVNEDDLDENDKSVVQIIGCGVPYRVNLVIVNVENNHVLQDDQVGEIWISSPSVAKGYWGLSEKTEETFGATPVNYSEIGQSPGPHRFLRTGDLGFIHKTELFICGRIKDLVIIRGKNHYPQDIERTAESSSPEIRGGCSAAFSIPMKNEEALILILEVREPSKLGKDGCKTPDELIEDIKYLISTNHGVSLSAVHLLHPRTIPKTTSGKIARQWCKKALVENKLSIFYSWHNDPDVVSSSQNDLYGGSDNQSTIERLNAKEMSDDDILNLLLQLIAKILKEDTKKFDVNVPVMKLGLGSMEGMYFLSLIEQQFGAVIPEELFFDEQVTLKSLVQLVRTRAIPGVRPILIHCPKVLDLISSNKNIRPLQAFAQTCVKSDMITHKFKESEIKPLLTNNCFIKSSDELSVKILFATLNYLHIFFILICILSSLLFGVITGLIVMLTLGALSISLPFLVKNYLITLNRALVSFYSFTIVSEFPMQENGSNKSKYLFVALPNNSESFDQKIAMTLFLNFQKMLVGSQIQNIISPSSFRVTEFLQKFFFQSFGIVFGNLGSVKKFLLNGKSVLFCPFAQNIKEKSKEVCVLRKQTEIIKIAMETGAEIVPVYFTSLQKGSTSPYSRKPLVAFVATPISVPHTSSPTPELIYQSNDELITSVKAIYRKYCSDIDSSKSLTIL